MDSVRDVSGLVRHVLRAKLAQKYAKSVSAANAIHSIPSSCLMQPVLVVSKLGAGRAGCFCALSVAYELMTAAGEPQVPETWRQDSNILDQVRISKNNN